MVQGGLLPGAQSNACLQAWSAHQKGGGTRGLPDFFVQAKLLTPTQAAVLCRETLTERQPFPEYKLLRQAGEGGMAIVFEATFLKFTKRVALKVLDTPFSIQEAYRLRFLREANILLELDHENIVRGRDHRVVDGVALYAMDFVDGISVQHLLDEGVDLSERFCLHVASQAGAALAHMHGRGIVHRDLKPSNFVVDHTGHMRMIDFGLAKVMAGMRQDTSDDTTVGTVEYISPEQARNRPDVDGRSDLYSLGASLFHMTTGDLPFQGSPEEIMVGHVTQPLEFTAAQKASVSAPVQYVIRKLMAKDPAARYPDAAAFLAEMRALCKPLLAQPLDIPDEVKESALESAPIDLRKGPRTPFLRKPAGLRSGRRPGRPGHRRPFRR